MSSAKRIQFSATIHAPVPTVWRLMIGPESYKHWASAFAEGSHFDGSWEQGAKIKFLSPSGDGMVAEIVRNRKNEFISIRHLGFFSNGVEDTTSESVRAWAPAYENYTFIGVPEGTKLVIELNVPGEWEQDLTAAWPKALALLKQLGEAESADPYHAHIYYDASDRPVAEQLHSELRTRSGAGDLVDVVFVGEMTDRPVGPHPVPQYEVHFYAKALPAILEKIKTYRLRALVHRLTDDDLADHTSQALWIGEPLTLDLLVLDPPGMNQGIARFGKSDF